MNTEEIDQLKDHIKTRILEVSTYYAGDVIGREGKRFIFHCPRCGHGSFHTYPEWISGPITGCWNGACSMPRSQDALTLISEMEDLDNKKQFWSVLEVGARITGVPYPDGQQSSDGPSTNGSSAKASPTPGSSSRQPTTEDSTRLLSDTEPEPEEDPELNDRVYKTLLSMCALSTEVWEGLQDRGLKKDTILDAGISYLTAAKGPEIVKALHREFEEDLLRVPGFYASEQAQAGCWSNFAGKELILFPYYDGHGLISTIEGRVMFGKEQTAKYKYLSFTGSGSHAYLFPGMGFENIEAFCEGLMGAIVAAQEGICVASIQGFRRYRAAGGKYPLPQLVGVDFAGRTIVYIPDMDEPPKLEVAQAAPDAARWLVERQNGTPLITLLPSGKDLDEFLLTVQPQHRRKAFDKLIEKFSRTPEVYEKQLSEGSLTIEASRGTGQAGDNQEAPGTTQQERREQSQEEPPADTEQQDTDETADSNEPAGADEAIETNGASIDHEDDTPDHSGNPEPATTIDAYAPAAGLTGEQFYREDFEYPPEPPDPLTAIFGKEGQRQTEAQESEEDGRSRKERIKDSLRSFGDSLAGSTYRLLGKGAAAALELLVIWAVLYVSLLLVLEVLTPLGAFAGMWKIIAVAVVLCALLRTRLARRRRRFLTGVLVPGKK